MSGPDPFRSELDAAHRRIETLEAENAARVKDLETENAHLRQRLIDVTPSRNATGRTFAALGMLILSLSLAAGMVFARLTGAPAPVPFVPVEIIELPSEATTNAPASAGDFDRVDVAFALDHVHVEDCVKAGERGGGHVKLTLAPSGLVSAATVDRGVYAGTSVGHCIEDRYRAAHVPAFTGSPRIVGKSFVMP